MNTKEQNAVTESMYIFPTKYALRLLVDYDENEEMQLIGYIDPQEPDTVHLVDRT